MNYELLIMSRSIPKCTVSLCLLRDCTLLDAFAVVVVVVTSVDPTVGDSGDFGEI